MGIVGRPPFPLSCFFSRFREEAPAVMLCYAVGGASPPSPKGAASGGTRTPNTEEERDNTIHNFAAAGSQGTKKQVGLLAFPSWASSSPKNKKRKGKGQGSSYLFTRSTILRMAFPALFAYTFPSTESFSNFFLPQVFEQILMGASGFNSSFPNSASASAVGEGMAENGK